MLCCAVVCVAMITRTHTHICIRSLALSLSLTRSRAHVRMHTHTHSRHANNTLVEDSYFGTGHGASIGSLYVNETDKRRKSRRRRDAPALPHRYLVKMRADGGGGHSTLLMLS